MKSRTLLINESEAKPSNKQNNTHSIAAPNNEHLMTLHHNLFPLTVLCWVLALLTSQFTPSNYNYGQTASTAGRVRYSTVTSELKQVFALSVINMWRVK